MSDTFTCDDCGREFPREQMKELFIEGNQKVTLCAECLDKRMNESSNVVGVAGDEKRRAAATDVDAGDERRMQEAGRGVYGERG